MKKSLLALAALSAFAGVASAQSSVTLFGIVDTGYARISSSGRGHVQGLTNSGLNSSRLGFRGVEDLGGGLRAGFHLEGQIFSDNGQGVNATTGYNFQRRSTVSLFGGFGEIRLGRDYTPHFLNVSRYDPFGTNGIGTSMLPSLLAGAGVTTVNSTAGVRQDNAVSYIAPAIGGLQLQVMLGFGEQQSVAANKDQNDFFGFHVGYAAGPLSVHYAYGKTDGATTAADLKVSTLGGQYTFGPVTPTFVWTQEKAGSGAKANAWEAGVLVNIGQGTFRAAYSDHDLKNSSNDWKKLAVGYIYNMSKRTALYGTYARVANDGAQVRAVGNNGLTSPVPTAGGNSTGIEFGVRHSF